MFKIADKREKSEIIKFYDEVIEANNKSEINLRWQKDVHPSHHLLNTSVDNGELFLWKEDEILAACVMNKSKNEDYSKVSFEVKDDENVGIIHVLGVSPGHFREGIAGKFLEGLFLFAKEKGIKAIKLDVFKINTPAIALYEKAGFINRGEVRMFVPRIGFEDFYLFEKVIK